ncbi:hypothetical protein VVR12_05540 [Rothia sp. LK2588]|uniref:hypothetical protein n=1 Tax=Rothia sp. LK2588 TaxID=3114369 RepID=UPI0034CD6E3E
MPHRHAQQRAKGLEAVLAGFTLTRHAHPAQLQHLLGHPRGDVARPATTHEHN